MGPFLKKMVTYGSVLMVQLVEQVLLAQRSVDQIWALLKAICSTNFYFASEINGLVITVLSFFKMGQSRPLFCLFLFFYSYNVNNTK